MTATSRAHYLGAMVDLTQYITVREPERFDADWAGHYRHAVDTLPALRSGYKHTLDHPYGEHPAQRLNIYHPPHADPTAVVAFIHGGGLLEGEPAVNDTLGRPWLDRGAIYATLGYRLTPDAYYPEQADDVTRALTALTQIIRREHPTPPPLLLAGHSIGATIASTIAYRDNNNAGGADAAPQLAGVMLISGVYDLGDTSPFVRPDTDPKTVSPIASIRNAATPTIVAYSTHEPNLTGGRPEAFAQQADLLCQVLAARGGKPQRIELHGDHVATVRAFGAPGELVEQGLALVLQT